MNTETTPLGQYLLRRQAKADAYTRSLDINTAVDQRSAFFAGWDKAIEEVGLMLQTLGGDGCFCTHHPDDPAHTKDCYDVIEYLLLQRSTNREPDECDAGYTCDRDDVDLTMKQPLEPKW